eukprot:43005_1
MHIPTTHNHFNSNPKLPSTLISLHIYLYIYTIKVQGYQIHIKINTHCKKHTQTHKPQTTHTVNASNTTTNTTFNTTNPLPSTSPSSYISTIFITTLFTEANVGISKELLYISGAIFVLIIIIFLIYCIYRCRTHHKQKQLSKKPVNTIDDIDEDTKKINSFEVTITKNKFALHNTQNAYTVNRLASSSNATVELNNRMHSTSTANTIQTNSTVSTMTGMNNQIQLNQKPITNSQLPEIKTEPKSNIDEFVSNTPIGIGDQRNRTGTIQYTARPSDQKVQAMLEPIDTPLVDDDQYNDDEHIRTETHDTNISNQTMKYMPENDINHNDDDTVTESDVSDSNSNSAPAPMEIPQIPVVDTLTAMIQQHKQSGAQ